MKFNFTLWERLLLLVGLAVAGLSFFAIAFVVSSTIERNVQNKQMYLLENADNARIAVTGLQSLDNEIRNYLANKDNSVLDGLEANERGIDDWIDQLIEAGKVDAAPRFQSLFGNYKSRARTVIQLQTELGLTENDGLEGALREAVHNIESKLAEFNDESLTVKMLMMRRHEKDFMLRLKPKYIDSLKSRIEEFRTILATRAYSSERKADLYESLDVYQRDFEAWANKRLALKSAEMELVSVKAILKDELAGFAAISLEKLETFQKRRAFRRKIATSGLVVALAVIIAVYGFAA